MKKSVFAFAILAFSGLINAQDTAQKPADVSVLPISGPGMDPGLLTVLSDDFRSALKESGSFSVMTRELMEEIMKEQAFQMSGACDEAGCLVEAGKVIGVSKIAAVTLTALPDRFFAASAQLIDVATGAVLVTASEKRQGDSYDVNKRMLRNLAAVLAGRPGQDHLDYLETEKRSLEETRQVEKIRARKFFVSVTGFGFYPLNIVQDDNEEPRRKYFNADPDLVEWSLPDRRFNFGGEAKFALSLKKGLWLTALIAVAGTATEEAHTRLHSNTDTTLTEGTTTMRLTGPGDIAGHSYRNTGRIDAGLGLRYDFFRHARAGASLSLLPLFGYLTYSEANFDSSFYNQQLFINSVYAGQSQIYTETEENTELSSFTFGADLSLSAEFFLKSDISICADASVNLMMAPALEGDTKVHGVEIMRDPINSLSRDTTYTEDAAMVKGDFLGTGEYLLVKNPDVKEKDLAGQNVAFTKSAREFSSFRIRIGLTYYF